MCDDKGIHCMSVEQIREQVDLLGGGREETEQEPCPYQLHDFELMEASSMSKCIFV